MLDAISRRARRSSSRQSALAVVLGLTLVLSACGGDDNEGAQIEWKAGTPPQSAMTAPTPASGEAPLPTPTVVSSPPTSPPALPPNELGLVPILEYHAFTTDPAAEAQFVRPIEDFRSDLEWLYAHDFYVIKLRDLLLNQVDAPEGKRPVVLTFDDSPASQFRYLIKDDGSLEIDPNSAVGVMEAFYAEHPDFGRSGFFGVLPTMCFDWETTGAAEDDQTAYCAQKLQWLLANGYEVGNHTLDHKNLGDVDDAEFKEQIGGAIEALQEMAPEVQADILVLPNGTYPGGGENQQQMAMLENGFEYNGRQFTLLGCLLVGANPTVSPVSTDWDPVQIPRIQVYDGTDFNDGDWGNSAYWFGLFEQEPEMLYVSDGNPNTITLSTDQPPALDGTFDPAKAGGKEVIEYDPETGEVV